MHKLKKYHSVSSPHPLALVTTEKTSALQGKCWVFKCKQLAGKGNLRRGSTFDSHPEALLSHTDTYLKGRGNFRGGCTLLTQT